MSSSDSDVLDTACGFLRGGGDAARLIEARDWRAHPLGAPETWPDTLKVTLGTVLNSPEAMILAWGPDELFVFFNDACLPLLGPRAAGAVGARFDQIGADAWKQARPIVEQALAGRSHRHVSVPFAAWSEPGATDTWWTFAYSRVLDPRGETAGLLIVATETTEQMLSARDQAESRDQLQRAQEAGGVGVFSVGADGMLMGSPELCRLYGFEPRAALPAIELERLVVPEDAHLVSTFETRNLGLTPLDVRYRIRRADTGELRWIERKGEVERDEAGNFRRFVGVARDATERVLVDEQLRVEREQLRQMFEQAPTFRALLRGPDHVIERVNEGYTRLIGGRDVVGRTVAEALPDAVEQGHLERLDRVYRSGEPFSAENVRYLVRTEPGATPIERYIDLIYQPLRDGDGTVTGVFIDGVDVTERMRAQQASRARDLQFQAFAQAMPNHVWTAPADGKLDWFNQRVLDYSGRSLDELIGDRWGEIVHPDDRAAAGTRWARSLLTGEDYETEFRIRRADGAYRWHLVRALPIRDEQGRVVRWIGSNTDTHEQKLSQAESAADRDRLWSMSQELLLVHTLAGTITAVNPSATRLLGWEPGEMVGRNLSEFLHPDDAGRGEPACDRSDAASLAFENRYRTRDGNYRLLSWTAVPEAGRIHAVGRDITEERRLARERERVWNISPVLKAVSDRTGTIIDVNPSWTQTLGWTREESIGRLGSDFMIDEGDAWAERVRTLASGQALMQYRTQVRTKDGGQRVIQWSTVPDSDAFYGFGRDVTAETEAAAALAETEAALRQAQKMEAVGQLTGGIAHDFNNLLQGITGSLEIVQRRVNAGRTADLERFISGALTAANRAASLTHRLLAFSRRQPLDPKPVRANALVASIEDLLRRTIGERIGLTLILAEDLWITRCDPNQLENAILNLVINARDAMPDGGDLTIETGNVAVTSPHDGHGQDARPGDYVCITVSDTGTGMDAATMAKAFDPFFTTKPIGQGTGLGLSMIYGFAQQSEGYARIDSDLGHGSTMRLYLPRYRGDVAEEEAVAEPTATQAGGAGDVVLVVEDEAVVRSLIVEELAELGFAALEAADGFEGLAILRSDRRIDLLVTDIGLPGMDGRQVADAARALRPALKILFMTGYAETAALSSGFLTAGMALITKPFTMDALAHRIRTMMEGG